MTSRPAQSRRHLSLLAAATIGAAAPLIVVGCGDGGDAPLPPAREAPLIGASVSETCAWPNVGWLPDLCTATLIHPRLIVYAAHCGTDFSTVTFTPPAGRRSVPITRCDVEPDGAIGSGRDVAFCLLGELVDDIPIVPAIAGCERSLIAPGLAVTVVGFGSTGAPDSIGTKREWTAPITRVSTELILGGDGRSICEGDSGGPAFARLAPQPGAAFDGTWRLLGVASSTSSDACDETRAARFSPIAPVLTWLEEASGVDVTPCFDDLQRWSPTSACGGSPGAAGTNHDGGGLCDEPPVGSLAHLSATCGAPFSGTSTDGGLEPTPPSPGGGCALAPPSPVREGDSCSVLGFLFAVFATAGFRRRRRHRRCRRNRPAPR